MIQFIKEYGYIIWVILLAVIYAISEWGKVKEIAQGAILNAKRQAKDKILSSGIEQENYAVAKFYPMLPGRIKIFISEAIFRNIIKWLYKKATDLADDGKLNKSNE